MADPERALFTAFLTKSARYLEFGTGGSTVLPFRGIRDKAARILEAFRETPQ
jgi:hypothetical protein